MKSLKKAVKIKKCKNRKNKCGKSGCPYCDKSQFMYLISKYKAKHFKKYQEIQYTQANCKKCNSDFVLDTLEFDVMRKYYDSFYCEICIKQAISECKCKNCGNKINFSNKYQIDKLVKVNYICDSCTSK